MFKQQKLPFRVTWLGVKRRGVIVIEEVFPDDHLFVGFLLCRAVSEQQAHAIAWRKIKKHYGGDVHVDGMDATVDRSAAALLPQNGNNDPDRETPIRSSGRASYRPARRGRHSAKPQIDLFSPDALSRDP